MQVLVYPLDVAKTRLAVARAEQFQGLVHCLRSTVQREGVGGLYKGITPALAGIMPVAGVDLAAYNTLKEWWKERPAAGSAGTDFLGGGGGVDGVRPPLPLVLGFGAVAAVSGALVGYPLTVVRTRLMLQGMEGYSLTGR
jgi:solute carrier family 25 phosphate transporter 23/24/25/41